MLGDLPKADGPVTVQWGKTPLHLLPNATPTDDGRHYAIHGMLSGEAAATVSQHVSADGGDVEAIFHCGDFHGHWPSLTDVLIRVSLSGEEVHLSARAANVGPEAEPMGIGTHPYFRILSGDRTQVRLHIPGSERALVNNYTDVFPTGKVESVAGTPYDLRAPGGAALGERKLDDQWLDLSRDHEGVASAVLIDPKAHLGIRVAALSSQITAIQAYAPPDKMFVAIEDQFNRNDPFGAEWHGQSTGMVQLAPGESVTWAQCLSLFVPQL
jgi:galactose mutarotase-like enzyme